MGPDVGLMIALTGGTPRAGMMGTRGMTPFYFICASLPFALYMLALSWLHSRRRPTLVTSRRDCLALILSSVGVLFIGPLQILPGFSAWLAWGPCVWILVALFFFFLTIGATSRLRPRFVVYNTTADALRKTLTKTALELDDDARWQGDAMNLPGLGVQFFLDDSPRAHVTSIVGIGRELSARGWLRLRAALDTNLAQSAAPARRYGVWFALFGVALLAADVVCFVRYYDAICAAAAFYMSV